MNREIVAGAIAVALSACSSAEQAAETGASPSGLSYYADTKSIIDQRCANCHAPGEIGPFSLTNYEEVSIFAVAMRASIEAGTMPPWMPSPECNSYQEDIDLTADEEATLLAWLEDGALAGDPADAPSLPEAPADPFEPKYSMALPEAYTPTLEPDDYRCQVLPWPAEGVEYVTGLRVQPDQRAIVHHVIVFLAGPDQAAQYQAYDDAEEGPGYTCYGGPTGGGGPDFDDLDLSQLLSALQDAGLSLADLQSGNIDAEELSGLLENLGLEGGGSAFETIGSWVPGVPARPFPEGTGIRIEPGSMLVAQFHYNTSSADPAPDQSVLEISTVDSVQREATSMAVLDVGWVTNGLFGEAMTIPAGDPEVQHSTSVAFDDLLAMRSRSALGLPEDAPLLIHSANHHMHELGVRQRSELRHADGSASCLLDVPEWDFDWQGSYTLEEPVLFRPGDELWMGCTWDNSAANQPIINGAARAPIDVAWGEGTSDEMCLGSFYVTAE